MSTDILQKKLPAPEHATEVMFLRREKVPLGETPDQADATMQVRCGARVPTLTGVNIVQQVAGYEILEELGRGGMGVVYKAWQKSLRRTVALKMILTGSFASDQDLDRFRAEALAVARLHHPHLLSIFEIGDSEHLPFYAMEYLQGGSLARRLNGEPIDARTSAMLVRSLAQAMDYAHKNGIVHRDLKPANILLSADAQTPLAECLAKITDFGIAKQLHCDASHTQTGDILGTPHYMAPEQASGRPGAVGPAADIYSLGAILYEMLTGRPPFHGHDGAAVLILVSKDEPERPRHWVPNLPADIETICLKCLEKDPAKRYASAAALADDLTRFLQFEPIHAKPATMADRALKWIKRRPTAAASIAMTSVLFAIAFSMMAGLLFQAVENADMKAALLNQAEENASTQVELLTQTKVLLADAYLDRGIHLAEKGDVRRGMHWMVRALEMTEEVQRRDPTGAAHLAPIIRMNLASWGQCVASREISLVHTDWVWDVAFSPDQKVVVTGSRDKRVQTWHARTGQRLGPSLDHPHPVWGIAFHPNGTLFTLCGDVALGDAGLLTVWTPVADKPGHFTPRGDPAVFPYDLMRMCMSPAGDRIWISSRAGESVLYAFDPEGQGNGLRTVGTPPEGHHQLPAFSPDGAMYATIVSERPEFLAPPGFTKQVQLWDARTGNALGAPLELPGVVRTVLFSADGKHLIVGSATSLTMEHGETSLIQVWDLDRRKCVSKSHPLPGRIKASTLSHGGQLFAVSLFDYSRTKEPGRIHVTDGHIELWQVTANGDLESYGTSLRTHHVVWHMTFSPDDRMLLAGCENHGASLWSVSTCQRLLQPIWHEGNCVKVAFTKDGRTAVTASAGGGLHAAARLWEVPSFSHIGRPLSAPDGITAAYWENDGKHVWIASGFTQARWDPLRARKTDSFSTPNFVHRVHPTGDDRRVFVDIGNEGPLRALHHDTRQLKHLPHRFNHTERGFSYMYHPQKQLFLQCWAKPCKMQLRDSEGNPVSPVMNAADFEMTARELSPDASLLAVALTNMGHSNKLIVVRTRDMATLHDIPLKYEINALGFTPDGKHLAFGGKDRQVQRLNTETGKLLSAPLLHEGVVYWTSYLGGDRVLATSSEKGLILLWDAPTGKRIGPAFAHCADLSTIAVHPQGKYLLTAPTGKLAMTWRVPDSAEGPLERIRSWVETTTGMEMTENDTIVPLDMDTVMQKRQRLAADR